MGQHLLGRDCAASLLIFPSTSPRLVTSNILILIQNVFSADIYLVNRPYSLCQSLKPSLVFLNRASYGRRRNNDVTSQEREVTMMLRHNLRTDAQICGKSATQASLFVRHGRGVNRVYSVLFFNEKNACNNNNEYYS